jgi:hypothetical protein
MCNAHNHPPGCPCGWGGVWYGHGNTESDWLFRREPRPRKLGPQRGTSSLLAGGFTVPNSRCPVCNASVYYYESPYGGRVFFDSLGPPWPKHPCTFGAPTTVLASSGRSWQQRNWEPVTSVAIEAFGRGGDLFRISGRHAGHELSAYFRAHEVVMAEIVRVRKAGSGRYDVSILDYDTVANCWYVWDGKLFVSDALAGRESGLTKTLIHSHAAVAPIKAASADLKPAATDVLQCPDCNASVGSKRLARHLRHVHGYQPLGSLTKITGRMILSVPSDKQSDGQ